MANSGGGIIVFGLNSFGVPTGDAVDLIVKIDPADCANKILKYTGAHLDVEISAAKKQGYDLAVFIISGAPVPLAFQQAGCYQDASTGKQYTAFHKGTFYFRHGAKSEPGTSDDIRKVIDRQLDQIRKSWIKGVSKVVKAPAGAQIIAVPATSARADGAPVGLAKIVRPVKDPNALAVRLTRDSANTTGTFIHEEVSSELFDEINNVIDANRILAKGQRRFFLGQPVYFRIYAERQRVTLDPKMANLLLHAATTEFYAPCLFWMQMQSDLMIAESFKEWFSQPRHSHRLVRFSALLGYDFSNWYWEKVQAAWQNNAQPPPFYWTLKAMLSDFADKDPRVIAARQSLASQVLVPGQPPMSTKALLERTEHASTLLSTACMQVFDGATHADLRSTARTLDYLAYGDQIMKRAPALSKEIIGVIGNQPPGIPDTDTSPQAE